MKTVVGVFRSEGSARHSTDALASLGIPRDRISLLTPGASPRQTKSVATTEAEQPGMGKALGGLVGGTVGVAGGVDLASAAASVLIPGVGPVLATGLFGAALLGAVGAVAGSEIGDALETALAQGLPKDEIYVYQDALRRGRSVVIALADTDEQAAAVRRTLAGAGAESVDAARRDSSIGLHDVREEKYGTY